MDDNNSVTEEITNVKLFQAILELQKKPPEKYREPSEKHRECFTNCQQFTGY